MPDITPKQRFLSAYDREHATTMRVLGAFPAGEIDTRLHPKVKTAKELAWTFVLERYLGTKVWHDEFAKQAPSGTPPAPPNDWDAILKSLEKSHGDFRRLIESSPDAQLTENVHFVTGPNTMGEIARLDWAWFLLHDEIHHRGQFSVLLRMAGGKVPSIYGPSGDEPWM
jgi:uncharacterized damage-inducible protein DinB